MIEATPFLPGLSPLRRKPLTAAQDAGNLTCNGGLIVLRESALRSGVAAVVADAVPDSRCQLLVTHSYRAMVTARMMAIAAGHADVDDLDDLRFDPALMLACNREPEGGHGLPSQPVPDLIRDLAPGERSRRARSIRSASALSASPQARRDTLLDALEAILGQELWQVGGKFDTFAEFAIAQQPAGLGVRSSPSLKLLRYALLANGHFASWTELLERLAREPGRPPRKLVNDEDFERFYTVPTATTARDRLLLGLKRHHPEHFAAVCALECSPREATRWGALQLGAHIGTPFDSVPSWRPQLGRSEEFGET